MRGNTAVIAVSLLTGALLFPIHATASSGPDVAVGLLWGPIFRWGKVGDITAYSIGTTSCNLGDQPVLWVADTNQHPVIAQNLYRLKDGRFEQIGMSWLKHSFAALAQTTCGPCQDPNNSQLLGVGCSDPYSPGLNGQQSLLGPRSQVNAATGYFPYPFTAPNWNTLIDRRLQVHDADIKPSLNPGALYFVEGHYVTADDALAGNSFNNASYQRVLIGVNAGIDNYSLLLTGTTQTVKWGIQAWKDNDPSVTLVNVVVPNDGVFILGSKVTDLGTGFWRYEYALQNAYSDRSAGSFNVPLDEHTVRMNEGFHDVDYHSGEPYSLTDWPVSHASGFLTWATDDYNTNPNANALRWATLYNYRFVCNSPPIADAQIQIGLFKPGSPASVTASILGPSPGVPDCDNNTIPDWLEIQGNPSLDCDGNGNLDACDFDCNQNAVPDACEMTANPALDCNNNGLLDVCEIPVGSPAPGGPFYCTSNCAPDCNDNGLPDSCDIASGFDPDCNGNNRPDSCDIALGFSADCDHNDIPDSCQIAQDPGLDCNLNGVLDTCAEVDCNNDNIPDDCQGPTCPGILAGDSNCNGQIDLADLPTFVNYVMAGQPTCRADMNHDGKVDGLDIAIFADALTP